MEKIIFPKNCKAVVDVTKAPYFADNTGQKDCTDILNRAIHDFYLEYLRLFNETEAKLAAEEDPDAVITFEVRKVNGRKNVIFPETLPECRIIYFPEGEYLVSDTITYYFDEFRNILGDNRNLEMNAMLRLCGENMENTVIRLRDHCQGFGLGADKPVVSYMNGRASNIAQSNMFENITIDTGKENPGATGLVYFANNSGAVRNVTIRSGDPEAVGNTGFAIVHDRVSAGYVKNLTVIGFNYGIRVIPQLLFTVFENIVLQKQRRIGMYLGNTVVSIHGLKSENTVPAVWIQGVAAFVALIDAQLLGGSFTCPAIRYEFGQCLLRNITSSGYEYTLSPAASFTKADYKGYIEEYCSHGPVKLREEGNSRTLNLEVLDTPVSAWPSPDDWACVNDYGAAGDGITDDTAAVQKAMDSGKSAIWFQPGHYLLEQSIWIPSTVNRVNFMYCDLVSGPGLKKLRGRGTFLIKEESDTPLIMEDLMTWESFHGYMTLIEHGCRRTLVISDVHCQVAPVYFNTVAGGKVFIENVGCTVGGIPGAGARKTKLKFEEKFEYSRETPCFHFVGQTVYCRLVNPERSLYEMVNDGGLLWVLGFKTEEEGTAFYTKNGGKTEVLGGVHAIGLGLPVPLILNEDSDVSVFSSICNLVIDHGFPVAIKEIKEGEIITMGEEKLPIRFMNSHTLPPYVGYAGKN